MSSLQAKGTESTLVPFVPLADGLFIHGIFYGTISLDASNFHCMQSNYLYQNILCVTKLLSIEEYYLIVYL